MRSGWWGLFSGIWSVDAAPKPVAGIEREKLEVTDGADPLLVY
jgi:hypothetical protein